MESLPLIGIGASAGGLDALRRFLDAVQDAPGAVFFVVQHLAPDHESVLAELLERSARIRIVRAEHGARIAADTVYVAPAGSFLSLDGTRLQLSDLAGDKKRHAPIDHLFRSLASAAGSRAVCVVLSGTGRDGEQGLRAIKSAGGAALVQSPDDAEFAGMPRAALDTGLVDAQADAAGLAALVAGICQAEAGEAAGRKAATASGDPFDPVLRVLRDDAGYDFGSYKHATLERRILRRQAMTDAATAEDYAALLQDDADERGMLVKDLLIGVTSFFRDAKAWQALGEHAIDPLLAQMGEGETLRAWSAGCASGEEAYSLAILARERIEASGRDIGLQVFGTDLNAAAIDYARAGLYPVSSAETLSDGQLDRWFLREDDGLLRVNPELRAQVVFAAQNAIHDPPFSSMHLVTCRNLLIYLDTAAQRQLAESFHFALRDEGYLFLGTSESVERAADLFEPVAKAQRVYRRKAGRARRVVSDRPRRAPAAESSAPRPSLTADAAVHTLLSRYAPPAVLVSDDFELKGLHGDVTQFLTLRSGTMTSNLMTMLGEPYRAQAWAALQGARRDNRPAEVPVNPVGDGARLSILAEPVHAGKDAGFLVSFLQDRPDAAAPGGAGPAGGDAGPGIEALDRQERDAYEREILQLRQELQAVIERSESSNHDLQAANEEAMSANEELQSSNEELETSREELQSLNEELTTLNSELEEKVADLEAANDDLANLIASTDIAIIFLDPQLRIRLFSDRVSDILSIRDRDRGRPLGDLALRVDDPDLTADARRVLDRLEPIETEVDGMGRTYSRRIALYRTRHDKIDGVIVTYTDITRIRDAARRMALQAQRMASVVELGRTALGSDDIQALFDQCASDLAAQLGCALVGLHRRDDPDRLTTVAGIGLPRGQRLARDGSGSRDQLAFTLARSGPVLIADARAETRFEMSEPVRDAGVRSGVCVAVGPGVAPWGVIELWWSEPHEADETEINYLMSLSSILWLSVAQAETRRLRDSERRELQDLIDGLPILVGAVDPDLRLTLSNRAFERLGWVGDEAIGAGIGDIFGEEAETLCGALLEDRPAPPQEREVVVRIPGEGARTHLFYAVPRRDRLGLFIAGLDIDDRKRGEERNRVISAELDHRVKNILALVNTIARMTARTSSTYDEFKSGFLDRIQSLSRTHAKLASSNWDGVSLRELIEDELRIYSTTGSTPFRLDGEDGVLTPGAAQSLALAIHELATNAAKYGALSSAGGDVAVVWRTEGGFIVLTWTESGLGPVEAPTREGYGTIVIRTAIETQLGGSVERHFGQDGLRYRLAFPRSCLVEDGGGA